MVKNKAKRGNNIQFIVKNGKMKKLLNGVFALMLFSITANAAEVVTATNYNYAQVPTNPGEKNKANSGIDTWTSLSDGVAMITGKAKNEMNIPSEQILKLQAEYISEETGKTVTASEVKSWYQNGEYEIWTPAKWTAVTGEKPTNFGTDVTNAKLFVSEVYDPNANLLVLKPKSLPGWSFASLKEGCLNYQEGSFYEPTGDSDSDYSLPPSGSDATATATASVGDVDVTVYTGEESSDEGGDTYIENYYEAGSGSGSGITQDYPYYDDQLYWSLGASWSQCGGWSFNGGLSNSPYGVGGGSGYGYNSGYNSGFGQYCGENGFGGTYNTINNYYYGDVNSHNNNNINSGNTTFNWQQWVNNHNNDDDDPPPPPVIDDPLPTNTGGIEGMANGENLPGNNSGTTTGKQPSGFKKDFKKSTEEGKDVYYANADQTKKDEGVKTGSQSKSNDKVDGVKTKNDVKAKKEGQSKEKPEFNASAEKEQIKDQGNERNFEKRDVSKQEANKPAEKQFEKKEPVKKQKEQPKPKVVEQKKTNVDENYDRPAKEYQKKKSPEVKKSAPVKKSSPKSDYSEKKTRSDAGSEYKSNSSKKSSGKNYKSNQSKAGSGKSYSRNSGGNGKNYSNKNNGNRQNGNQNSGKNNSGSSSPKRGR